MKLLVKRLEWEAQDVLSLTLVHPEGDLLPVWSPGAHLELHLRSGLIKHYSLCSSPEDLRKYVVSVLRIDAGSGGSVFIHDELRIGELIEVQGPKNNFEFIAKPKVIFIAGGIGITPILSMLEKAKKEDVDWQLFYAGRSRKAMAFLEHLEKSVNPEDADRISFFPRDKGPRMDLDAVLRSPKPDTAVYCCGPERLISGVQAYKDVWPTGTMYFEHFAAPKGSAANALDSASTEKFTVCAQASGITVEVEQGVSVLDALETAGVPTVFSCREGICGSCEVKVLDGIPEHRDLILSDLEREDNITMMPCVSRAKSKHLVLEL